MPKISFSPPKVQQNQSNTQNKMKEESSIKAHLFFDKPEQKNALLHGMLQSGLKYKDTSEIKEFCINELKAISRIVAASGDENLAMNKLSPDQSELLSKSVTELGIDKDHANKLISLFTNRNSGFFGEKSVNRTAAKYVETVRQILDALDKTAFTDSLNMPEQKNIHLIRTESKNSYIQNVHVNIEKENTLTIQLGRQGGTMGTFHKLEIKISEENKLVEKHSAQIISKEAQIQENLVDQPIKSVTKLTNNIEQTVSDYNGGKLNLCVTMLGYQIAQKGYDNIINNGTINYIEQTFVERRNNHNTQNNLGSQSNFSATAFDNQTQVNLIRSRVLATEKYQMPNIGFVFNPDKLESIQVAAVGDAWTKFGGENKNEQVENPKFHGEQKTITKYISKEGANIYQAGEGYVTPKNKALKNGAVRMDNNETIQALVKRTKKHGYTGHNAYKLHPKKSETTNELLFMPKTDKYFDAVEYILVDNSQLKHKDITQHKNWQNVTNLANQTGKPILVLQDDGKTLEYIEHKKKENLIQS